MKLLLTAITLVAMTISVAAQWLNHPTPGIPRTADGKANLTTAAPHARREQFRIQRPDLAEQSWTAAFGGSTDDRQGPEWVVTHLVEIHVSGNYSYKHQR